MDKEKEYMPTTAERKILEALSNPENYTLSITKLCEKADVSRNIYYEACKKDEFVSAKNKVLNKTFEKLVPEVKRSAMKFAINEEKNFQDRKMILEMTGEYKVQQDINLSNDIGKDALLKELDSLEKNKKVK